MKANLGKWRARLTFFDAKECVLILFLAETLQLGEAAVVLDRDRVRRVVWLGHLFPADVSVLIRLVDIQMRSDRIV